MRQIVTEHRHIRRSTVVNKTVNIVTDRTISGADRTMDMTVFITPFTFINMTLKTQALNLAGRDDQLILFRVRLMTGATKKRR